MRRPESINSSLCSLLFIIVVFFFSLQLFSLILLFQKYYYHHTRYYLYQNRHHHCHNTVKKKYMYSQVENVAFTGEVSVGRIRGLCTTWEGDTGDLFYFITNTKTYRRILLFVIIAQNENLPFGLLEFHNKKDNQIIKHNKGKSIQIKPGKKL